ncbi:hypothetical protein NT6N_11760 [Oceaniferula spumae]|uniref:Ancillary SecYEG translocon subunit n=1 Tax=Oceaniferula spumae TaxID=2979115 RepID=A0AAT9FJK3_9BACT
MAETPTPIAEIDHGPSKLDQFLDKHTAKLVIGAIVIALGVIGYVIYAGVERSKHEAAGSALNAAESVGGYQDVIKEWPGSKAAVSAQLLLAGAQWEDSQADAIKTLQDFLADHSDHPASATAKVSLGLRLLEQGKTDEATTVLTEVANDDTASYISPLAIITLGDIAKAAGKNDEAKNWYQKATADNTGQGNTFADTAKSRLDLVNAVPPTKIKPTAPDPAVPPAPPAAPGLPTPGLPLPPASPEAGSTLPPLEAPDAPAEQPEADEQPEDAPAEAPDEEADKNKPSKSEQNPEDGPRV